MIDNELLPYVDSLNSLFESCMIPARVVDIVRNYGSISYAVELQIGVRVNKITSLKKEISIILGTSEVSFDIPLNGTHYLGITQKTNSYIPVHHLSEEEFMLPNKDILKVRFIQENNISVNVFSFNEDYANIAHTTLDILLDYLSSDHTFCNCNLRCKSNNVQFTKSSIVNLAQFNSYSWCKTIYSLKDKDEIIRYYQAIIDYTIQKIGDKHLTVPPKNDDTLFCSHNISFGNKSFLGMNVHNKPVLNFEVLFKVDTEDDMFAAFAVYSDVIEEKLSIYNYTFSIRYLDETLAIMHKNEEKDQIITLDNFGNFIPRQPLWFKKISDYKHNIIIHQKMESFLCWFIEFLNKVNLYADVSNYIEEKYL